MTPCLNIQVDESGIKKPSKPVKVDAECQATEETMYDFQPSVFSDLPKDRFLERSFQFSVSVSYNLKFHYIQSKMTKITYN